jgi:tRNA G18 (ribose-2'-O)-methylase SpoU
MEQSIYWNILDQHKGKLLCEIVKAQKDQAQPFSIAILNIEGGLNIATIIRTACLFGAEKVFIYGRTRFDRRGMVGAQNYIPIMKVEDKDLIFEKFRDLMENEWYYPIFCETGGTPIEEFECRRGGNFRPCFVFGNESVGIPDNFLDKGYPIVSIRQFSVMRSLNVAVAAGIVMHSFISRKET